MREFQWGARSWIECIVNLSMMKESKKSWHLVFYDYRYFIYYFSLMSALEKYPDPWKPSFKIVDIDPELRRVVDRNLWLIKVDKELSQVFLHPEKRRKPKEEVMVSNKKKLSWLKIVRKVDEPKEKLEDNMVPQSSSIPLSDAAREIRAQVAALTNQNLQLESSVFTECPKDIKDKIIGSIKLSSRWRENAYFHFISELHALGMPWETILEAMSEMGFDENWGIHIKSDA